jgi:hypothetical protein
MPVTLPRELLQAKYLPGDFSSQSRCATALPPQHSVGREFGAE